MTDKRTPPARGQYQEDLAYELYKDKPVWGFGDWLRSLRELTGAFLLPSEAQSLYQYARVRSIRERKEEKNG